MSAGKKLRGGPFTSLDYTPPAASSSTAPSLTDESESDTDTTSRKHGASSGYASVTSSWGSRSFDDDSDQPKTDGNDDSLQKSRPKRPHVDFDEEDANESQTSLETSNRLSGIKKHGRLGKFNLEEEETEFGYEQLKKWKEEENKVETPGSPKKRQLAFDLDDEEKEESGLSFGARMLKKQGLVEGKGLGKHGHGIVEPIQAEQKDDRGGLGYVRMRAKLEEGDMAWEPGADVVSVEETINWIPSCADELPEMDEMVLWEEERTFSPKKLILDDEDRFCDSDLVAKVLRCKSALDVETGKEIEIARSKANPFEATGKHFFMNRAALKMANMDAVFGFMFTNPTNEHGKPLVDPAMSDDLLYFADVCAGPGGFTEYVLWKRQWHCRGFGFTLEGKDDFKIHNVLAGPAEVFEPFHGNFDNNSVYNPKNLEDFSAHVHKNTNQNGSTGVHFMMADGGFSVAGQENIQEILSKRLYLCQFLCALMVVREGGHFVCKLFDIFTPFSVGLVYLMYRCFQQVCIHKPNSSRPANSERYIICKGLRPGTEGVKEYLFSLNLQFNRLKPDEDIAESVPLDVLDCDKVFYSYTKESNERLAEIQCLHLAKTIAFITGKLDEQGRQGEIRDRCIQYWGLPDVAPEVFRRPNRNPDALFRSIVKANFPPHYSIGVVESPAHDPVTKLLNYRAVFSSGELFLILSLGRFNIHISQLRNGKFDGSSGIWEQLSSRPEFKDLPLQLPTETLILGEFVTEIVLEGDRGPKRKALHIIDAFSLGKENVSAHHYEHRIRRARKFAKALVQMGRRDSPPCVIRVKNISKSTTMWNAVDGLKCLPIPQQRYGQMVVDSIDENTVYPVNGMHFIQITKEPWILAWSNTQQKTYCFNPKTNQSVPDFPRGSIGDFGDALVNWKVWRWNANGSPADEARIGLAKDRLADLLDTAKARKS